VALALLVTLARQAGIDLIDCQMPNPHLQRLGSRSLPRDEFLAWLTRAVEEPPLTRLAAMTPTATAAIPELANFPS
jgi:leucyl/phenylalanyl-tRNA--protein transferase